MCAVRSWSAFAAFRKQALNALKQSLHVGGLGYDGSLGKRQPIRLTVPQYTMLRKLIVLTAMLLAVALGHAKSLYWRAVDVQANLDADGLMHVIETQTFVFDGDWNGGERRFVVHPGQRLQLEGVELIEDSRSIPLTRGGLHVVNHFELTNTAVLRWRSRLPSDPPFSQKALTYRIRYTLSGVLRGQDGHFRLNHDFAFPDRTDVIEQFTSRFVLDPNWAGMPSPHVQEQGNLGSGQGAIVLAELTHRGSSQPRFVIALTSPIGIHASLGMLVLGACLVIGYFLWQENRYGRFARVASPKTIDSAWLESNVFAYRPEVVSAIALGWGSNVVATILASLVQKRQVASRVEKRWFRRPKLSLRLLVDAETLPKEYSTLINKLFFDGNRSTDTDALLRRYAGKGLNLTGTVDALIGRELNKLPDWSKTPRKLNWKLNGALLIGSLVAMVATALAGSRDGLDLLLSQVPAGLLTLYLGVRAAESQAWEIDWMTLRILMIITITAPLLGISTTILLDASAKTLHVSVLATMVAWNLAVLKANLDSMRINQSARKIQIRKNMCAARQYFRAQLGSSAPQLKAKWLPYVVALGLVPKLGTLFESVDASGVAAQDSSTAIDTEQDSFSVGKTSALSHAPAAPVAGWSDSVSASTGVLAGGSWLSAVAGMNVHAPSSGGSAYSSSSSSNGSTSSGSSSGGGGGGGW